MQRGHTTDLVGVTYLHVFKVTSDRDPIVREIKVSNVKGSNVLESKEGAQLGCSTVNQLNDNNCLLIIISKSRLHILINLLGMLTAIDDLCLIIKKWFYKQI